MIMLSPKLGGNSRKGDKMRIAPFSGGEAG